MNIALIGYGKMGKEIEKIALERKHTITQIIDINNQEDFQSEEFKNADAAIEFTRPDSAFANFEKSFQAGVSVVSGTTGWIDKFDEIKALCKKNQSAFFYASNFSLGVAIFFKINEYLAKIMNNFTDYSIEMEEVHHTQKLDAPSGTAITLAEEIIKNIGRKNKWVKETAQNEDEIPIHAIRRDKVPGIHTIKYESDIDFIEITHSAKNRKGFALGAVLAAEFINKKKGIFTMNDLLKF